MIATAIIVSAALVITPLFLIGVIELTSTPTRRIVIRRRRRHRF